MAASPSPAGPVPDDPQTAVLLVRIALLEALLAEILDGMEPHPREGSGYWRQAVPVSEGTRDRWLAVLAGEG